MKVGILRRWTRSILPLAALVTSSLLFAQAPKTTPPPSILLGPRHGHVIPLRSGCTHTGGGNIDVAQPTPDALLITMTGGAVAYGSFCDASAAQLFDLDQALEIQFDPSKIKRAKLTLEGRVIGLLRSHGKHDSAGFDQACAEIGCGPNVVLSLCLPPHTVAGSDNLSVNDRAGPVSVPIVPGKYHLHQTFRVWAAAHKCLLPCKGPSAEFADQAIDPLWISYREPFHGAAKKDFGFQLSLKVSEDAEDKDTLPNPRKAK